MELLELSAAKGPLECCLAVAKVLSLLVDEASKSNVKITIIDQRKGTAPGTLRSALLAIEGENAQCFAGSWTGPMVWQCQSPYRPRHKRKNWYFAGISHKPKPHVKPPKLRIEALRASAGPGGQHVNKTASAIRITDEVSGLTVKVDIERSQSTNKRLAMALIHHKLQQQEVEQMARIKHERHTAHAKVPRGAPVRVFQGVGFSTSR